MRHAKPERRFVPAFCCGLVLSLQACASSTYPSPQPVAGSGVVVIDPHAPVSPGQFPGVAALCDHTLRGATRQVAAINLEGRIGLCFAVPVTGSYAAANNPRLVFKRPCVGGTLAPWRGESRRLIFQVVVGARDGVLGVDRAVGRLETKADSIVGTTQVRARQLLDMPPGTIVDGKLRYKVDGSWLTFADAAPVFSRPGYELAFEFDHSCDPDARYRLTITGVTIDDRELAVPAVDFVPFSETLTTFD
jgi:hypothetical protein